MVFKGLPLYFVGIVFCAALIALIYAHFLHTKRRRVVIPTIMFWSQLSGGQKYNSHKGRFSYLITFILLLSIISLFCVNLLKPELSGKNSQEYIFIFDCRNSMAVIDRETGLTRLDQSKHWCCDLLGYIEKESKITLISFDESVDVITDNSGKKSIVKGLINAYMPGKSYSQKSYRSALDISRLSVKRNPETKVFVFSDRDFVAFNDDYKFNNFHHINPARSDINFSIIDVKMPLNGNIADNALVTIACFSSKSDEYPVTVMLLDGQKEISSQNVNIHSGTFQTLEYDLPTNIDNPKFTLLSNDSFMADNVYDRYRNTIKYFTNIELPAPLISYFDSNDRFFQVKTKNSASIIISDRYDKTLSHQQIVLIPHEESIGFCRVVASKSFFPEYYDSEHVNLYVKSEEGFILDGIRHNPIMHHEDGSYLAAQCNSSNIALFLSESLFSKDSTFWKQGSYIDIMNHIVQKVFDTHGENSADLSYSDTYSPAAANKLNADVIINDNIAEYDNYNLFYSLSVVIVIMIVIEVLLYYKGRIV